MTTNEVDFEVVQMRRPAPPPPAPPPLSEAEVNAAVESNSLRPVGDDAYRPCASDPERGRPHKEYSGWGGNVSCPPAIVPPLFDDAPVENASFGAPRPPRPAPRATA